MTDDVYINTTFIHANLSGTDPRTGQHIQYYGEPSLRTRPIREPTHKWYLSESDYPARFYPNYMFGMGYAVSRDFAACAIVEMQQIRKLIPYEDVATGLLARRCNIQLTYAQYILPGESIEQMLMSFPYEILKAGGIPVKVVHRVPPEWMVLVHNQQPLP